MKVVLDTNVVIDAMANRKPFSKEAKKIMLKISNQEINGYISANSVTDIYYILRKTLNERRSRNIIKSLLLSLEVIDIDKADCWSSLKLKIHDFEDGIIVVVADKIKADYIITRDEEFLKVKTLIKIISPDKFLPLFSKNNKKN
jgi:predicted nucleic acid-binding protein